MPEVHCTQLPLLLSKQIHIKDAIQNSGLLLFPWWLSVLHLSLTLWLLCFINGILFGKVKERIVYVHRPAWDLKPHWYSSDLLFQVPGKHQQHVLHGYVDACTIWANLSGWQSHSLLLVCCDSFPLSLLRLQHIFSQYAELDLETTFWSFFPILVSELQSFSQLTACLGQGNVNASPPPVQPPHTMHCLAKLPHAQNCSI